MNAHAIAVACNVLGCAMFVLVSVFGYSAADVVGSNLALLTVWIIVGAAVATLFFALGWIIDRSSWAPYPDQR